MTNVQKPKHPPRGFVSLEAAAEILWQDESDRDARWGIAFLQIVAGSQGFAGAGKKVNVRLDWWQASADGPILVRARDIPILWPAFREWCGLPVVEDKPMSGPKRRRGRPKGTTIADDERLVNVAIDLLRVGRAKSPTDAARIVSEHAQGASAEAKYDRLRKKVLAEWQRRSSRKNN